MTWGGQDSWGAPAAPVLAGATCLTVEGPSAFSAVWPAAVDPATLADEMEYEVRVSPSGLVAFTRGATSAYVDFLVGADYEVRVRARNRFGNYSQELLAGTVHLDGPSGGGVTPDGTPPEIIDIVPAPASPLGVNEAVTFKLRDDSQLPLRKTIVTVFFANTGVEEVIHNGTSFAPFYVAGSTRATIDGIGTQSWRVVRTNGWLGDPKFNVYTTDATGTEA